MRRSSSGFMAALGLSWLPNRQLFGALAFRERQRHPSVLLGNGEHVLSLRRGIETHAPEVDISPGQGLESDATGRRLVLHLLVPDLIHTFLRGSCKGLCRRPLLRSGRPNYRPASG